MKRLLQFHNIATIFRAYSHLILNFVKAKYHNPKASFQVISNFNLKNSKTKKNSYELFKADFSK